MVEQDFNGEFLPDKLPIWAQDKAREWLRNDSMTDGSDALASLAALLVDVAAVGQMVNAENAEYLSTLRADVLAEVRRVVEDSRKALWSAEEYQGADWVLDEILARIEKL